MRVIRTVIRGATKEKERFPVSPGGEMVYRPSGYIFEL